MNDEARLGPDEWPDHTAPVGRPQIVVGGPGTGKTQFLTARVASAVIERGIAPDEIVVLGFSRSGVGDLRARLVEALGPPAHRVNVATYHALAMRIVEAHATGLGWDRAPTVLTAAEQEHFVARLLEEEPRTAWPAGYRRLLDSPIMAGEVTDFILRCHEQLLDAEDLAAVADARFVAMSGFLARYNERLTATHRTDYGRSLTDAVTALRTWPQIAAPYRLVVADEYQDSSPAQAEMLFLLAATGRDLTVAADPYQSIYSFRGSDIANVFSFPHDAERRLGVEADRIVLTTSYRVPSAILDAAVGVTARELPGGAGKVLSTRSGGSVAAHTFTTTSEEAEWVASDIERVHLLDGVPLERIAVFTRSNTDFGIDLASALERRSITHSFTESRLADEPAVRLVHDLVLAAGGGDHADLAIVRVLTSRFVALPYGTVNDMARRATEGTPWPRLITERVHHGAPLAALLEDPTWAFDAPAPAGLWHVWSTLPQLADVALDASYIEDRRAWSAFDQVLTRIVERSPGTTLADHSELVRDARYEADPLFSFHAVDHGGVTVSTLHGAKGTEFDVVYIANAVEGALPDLRARDSLLGARLLSPHLPTDTNDYVAFRLDEERRLAYTAMTRATSRVVWTATSNDSEHTGSQPSRFLSLVAPITSPRRNAEPLTPRSFEAALRRTARDPTAPAIERLAAIEVLAGGPSVGLSNPLERYGSLDAGPDDQIIPAPLRLSPSQATAYATCPRRYAIDRFLRTREISNEHMRFGTLIHNVLEQAEKAALGDGRARSTRGEAQDHLDALWDEAGFGDDAVGRSWRARAETTLDTLYDLWPVSGPPVALEHDLAMRISGVEWFGRADRIERRGDTLHVVDYKTSGQAVKVQDASESLQLGYYLLAARQDSSLSHHGEVAGAEFWYPRAKPRKTSITTRSFDASLLPSVTARLEEITTSIAAEAFEPTLGPHCSDCDVSLVCPARPEGKEAFAL
jgi:superfamily I DNA/RNA helicase/RecB family exonuclease